MEGNIARLQQQKFETVESIDQQRTSLGLLIESSAALERLTPKLLLGTPHSPLSRRGAVEWWRYFGINADVIGLVVGARIMHSSCIL